MNVDDPNFINALCGLQDAGERCRPKRGPLRVAEECKVNELPEFGGGADPEVYLDWERKIDEIFEFKELDDDKFCKYAILKLSGGASLWYKGLKSRRIREIKEKIISWETLK